MGYKNLTTTAHSAPKVLYSHDIFSTQFVGGISRYIYELYIRNENAKIATLYSENLYLGTNKKRKDFRGKGRLVSCINELAERLALAQEKFDIYHLSYYKNLYKPKYTPLVVTIHDMIHELYADSYFAKDTKTSKLKRLNCQQADGIIAISEQTKSDLIQIFEIPEEKIQVIYHGHSLRESHGTISLPDSYVLFVGGRSGYKNFKNFVYAFEILHKKYPHLQALCVGAPFNATESQLLAELNLDKTFTSIQAKENDLYTIYNKALCFVFPSFYEGFGIPILEAFFAKCASALSDIAVFREIADSSALYFDPHNPESIASTIETLLNNKDLKRTLIANATKRLELFSWDKTYQQTLHFYNTLIENKIAIEGGGQYNVILYFGSYCADNFSHSALFLKSQTTHSIFNLKKQEITNFSHIFAQDFSYYSRSYFHTLGGYMDKSHAA